MFANESSYTIYTVDAERKFYTFKYFESSGTKLELIEFPASLNTFGVVSRATEQVSGHTGEEDDEPRGATTLGLDMTKLQFEGSICEGLLMSTECPGLLDTGPASPTGLTIAIGTVGYESTLTFYQIAKPSATKGNIAAFFNFLGAEEKIEPVPVRVLKEAQATDKALTKEYVMKYKYEYQYSCSPPLF